MLRRLMNRLAPMNPEMTCIIEWTTLTLRVTIRRVLGCRIPMVMLLFAIRWVWRIRVSDVSLSGPGLTVLNTLFRCRLHLLLK